ncbi:MAG: molybdopterin-dependent oxidoreductase [Erysipelotrichaceae bacterium]|nr:molybdopterin-dependent oxidoreductase [Erysipelotrichaceae bacterium]
MKELKTVNKPVRKKDAMQLLTGQPVYTDDLIKEPCLIIKLLRSPHANAIVKEIHTEKALALEGIEAVFTYKDIDQDQERYTIAGTSFPEFAPYDRLIIDRHVRYVGDVVAIVVGKDEKTVGKAMKLIDVEYEVLDAVLDFRQALDNKTIVHPESNWKLPVDTGADVKRNLLAKESSSMGDIDEVLKKCRYVVDRTYHTKATQQCHMEPFTTFCEIDPYGRLHITSSTQIVFHIRHIVANALHIPKSMIRVSKPRVGGGFGAKQTAVSEVYAAFVCYRLKKACKLVFTRKECFTASSPRHEMQMHVRIGADENGIIKGIDLHTLSNTGAYGEHGPTTVGLSGHKSIPLYGKQEAYRFTGEVVYTNHMSSGAYRGFGATQGLFAVESAVNELASLMNTDPIELRLKNIVKEGEIMPAYFNEPLTSCTLDKCLIRAGEMIGWKEKGQRRILDNGKIRSLGVAIAMQGSGISAVDVGSATLKLNEGGFYSLIVGSADMGTGSDTTLSQVAAEVLDCDLDHIQVFSADTDISPYDSGSYASSTAYVTGKAVERCAMKLREKIIKAGAKTLECDPEKCEFDGNTVFCEDKAVSLIDIAYTSMVFNNEALEVSVSNSSPTSPPPFMAGTCELETDPETGECKVIEYAGVVDCGTPLNPNLTRIQTEGGIMQGIGMALSEDISYGVKGNVIENSFMEYKIPTRMDVGKISVEFEPSYEDLGPFGAKSIGEVVINTTAPAIQEAVYQACGKRFYELPIKAEDIALAKDREEK